MRGLLPATMVLILLSVTVAHADKITADPNAPGTRLEQSEESAALDARLAVKVTCEFHRKPVRVILDELSRQTGVSLYSGRNSKDWQVRDRRMNIFARDVPLAAVMNSISRVMKFKWEKSTEKGGTTYRLYMDRKSLLDAEARAAREEERRAEAEVKRRQKALESYMTAFTGTPEELEKMRDSDPFSYFVAKSGITQPLSKLFTQSPAILDALSSGKQLDLRGSDLSAEAQQSLVDALRVMERISDKMSGQPEEFPDNAVADMSKASIRVNSDVGLQEQWSEGSFLLGSVRVYCGDASFEMPMFDPQSRAGKAIGKMLVDTVLDDRPAPESPDDQQMPTELVQAIMEDVKAIRNDEPDVVHADAPWLHKKITLKLDSDRLDTIQAALSEAGGLAIVSDSFATILPPGASPQGSNVEMQKLLEDIAQIYGYDWDRPGAALEMRDKKWYSKRSLQIPDAWLDEWRNALLKNGTLTLTQMAQMAQLTYDQIDANLMQDDVLQNAATTVYMHRDLWQCFGALTNAQMVMLASDKGLDSSSLTPGQLALFDRAIKMKAPRFLSNAEDMRFNMKLATVNRPDGIIRNTLAVSSDDPETGFKFVMDMPHSFRPKVEKKADE